MFIFSGGGEAALRRPLSPLPNPSPAGGEGLKALLSSSRKHLQVWCTMHQIYCVPSA
ncbi:hypothetical protein GCM10011533_08040 [Streptosporangium jomthongense]|nr:hypothetical protein GCM10011533_08040 [Streptosporangium jomthongense]